MINLKHKSWNKTLLDESRKSNRRSILYLGFREVSFSSKERNAVIDFHIIRTTPRTCICRYIDPDQSNQVCQLHIIVVTDIGDWEARGADWAGGWGGWGDIFYNIKYVMIRGQDTRQWCHVYLILPPHLLPFPPPDLIHYIAATASQELSVVSRDSNPSKFLTPHWDFQFVYNMKQQLEIYRLVLSSIQRIIRPSSLYDLNFKLF